MQLRAKTTPNRDGPHHEEIKEHDDGKESLQSCILLLHNIKETDLLFFISVLPSLSEVIALFVDNGEIPAIEVR